MKRPVSMTEVLAGIFESFNKSGGIASIRFDGTTGNFILTMEDREERILNGIRSVAVGMIFIGRGLPEIDPSLQLETMRAVGSIIITQEMGKNEE